MALLKVKIIHSVLGFTVLASSNEYEKQEKIQLLVTPISACLKLFADHIKLV